jgi:hypothetical protein
LTAIAALMSDRTIIKLMSGLAALFAAVLLYVILDGAFGVRRRVIFFHSLEAAAFLSAAYVFAGLFQRRT